MSNQSISDKWNELDYFTQRQITYEFPEIFPECQKESIDTRNIEHFPPFKLDIPAILVLVVAISALLIVVTGNFQFGF